MPDSGSHESSGELESALQRDASEAKPASSYVWITAALVALIGVIWLVSSLGASNQNSQVPAAGDVPSASVAGGVTAGQPIGAAGVSERGAPDAAAEPGTGGSAGSAAAAGGAPSAGTSAKAPASPTGTARALGSGSPPQIPVPSGTTSAAPAKSAPSEGTQEATLNLTSMPPSQVSVGGRARGTTPLMGLKLAPGAYLIVFTNPTLGERVPAQVQLKPGQTKRVHVDFTGATPRVIQ